LCAHGALAADVRHELVATRLRSLGPSLDVAELADEWLPLTQAAMSALDADGVPPAARRLVRTASLRYRGQSFELVVPARDDLVAAFQAAHRQRYGYVLEGREVELVTLRLAALGIVPPPPLPRDETEGEVQLGRVTIVVAGEAREAPLLQRGRLRAGVTVEGPALIAEYSATTLVAPGWRCEVLPSGALALERAATIQ
jgi:N-methylhydantoinase A